MEFDEKIVQLGITECKQKHFKIAKIHKINFKKWFTALCQDAIQEKRRACPSSGIQIFREVFTGINGSLHWKNSTKIRSAWT